MYDATLGVGYSQLAVPLVLEPLIYEAVSNAAERVLFLFIYSVRPVSLLLKYLGHSEDLLPFDYPVANHSYLYL